MILVSYCVGHLLYLSKLNDINFDTNIYTYRTMSGCYEVCWTIVCSVVLFVRTHVLPSVNNAVHSYVCLNLLIIVSNEIAFIK